MPFNYIGFNFVDYKIPPGIAKCKRRMGKAMKRAALIFDMPVV